MSYEENRKLCQDMIKRHEGYRDRIYKDTVGVLTGGYGHAFLLGSYLPDYIWEYIFEYDFKRVEEDFLKLDLDHLSVIRKMVICDMLFNLGLTKLLKFKNMLRALKEENYGKAADEMLDSRWADQVGHRALELSKMMRYNKMLY